MTYTIVQSDIVLNHKKYHIYSQASLQQSTTYFEVPHSLLICFEVQNGKMLVHLIWSK